MCARDLTSIEMVFLNLWRMDPGREIAYPITDTTGGLEAMGLIQRGEYLSACYHDWPRWTLTAAGRAFLALSSPAAGWEFTVPFDARSFLTLGSTLR
jgi:hypothetical protein